MEKSYIEESQQSFEVIDKSRKIISEPMSDETFSRFSTFIHERIGIKMPDTKKTMLQARLQKRLWKLGLESFDHYADYLFSAEGMENELSHMINVVTTNKTDFFREPKHFEFLVQTALPKLINRRGYRKPFTTWCAGCSSGEEPYTLAMVFSEFAEQYPEFKFFILATDISEKVVNQAKLGIYDIERVEPVPMELRRKYLLKSKESSKELVRVVPELRAMVRFRLLNLMNKNYGFREPMDIIFCRNVIIYFDRPTQEQVLTSICRHLKPGGYLFTGHSETLNGMDLPLIPVSHTVYQKTLPLKSDDELPVVNLPPAGLHISEKPEIVRTVLGSCIAVTMFNRRLGISAICHALLPTCTDPKTCEDNERERYKYVELVIPIMLEKMQGYGIETKEIEVKLFGGADMLTQRIQQERNQPVGRLNIEKVMQILKAKRLYLKNSDVGGGHGRKIFFYTHTGEVLLKRLRQADKVF